MGCVHAEICAFIVAQSYEVSRKAAHREIEPEATIVVFLFVLETIRTSAVRVIHITVKTEETQRLCIKFVLYCST